MEVDVPNRFFWFEFGLKPVSGPNRFMHTLTLPWKEREDKNVDRRISREEIIKILWRSLIGAFLHTRFLSPGSQPSTCPFLYDLPLLLHIIHKLTRHLQSLNQRNWAREGMASMVAAAASGTSLLKPTTPFLGQGRSNVNPLRDGVSMGPGKYTMVLSLPRSLLPDRYVNFPIETEGG